MTFPISYPFDLATYSKIQIPVCNDTKTGIASAYGSWQPSSQFFVFVGVMVMLYCVASVIVYVFFDELYRHNHVIPKADFLATISAAVAWLFSSSMWAHGVSMVKSEVFRFDYNVPECFNYHKGNVKGTHACSIFDGAAYGGLDISLIFGFSNSLLWAANLWFLYKETAWHQENTQAQQQGYAPSAGPNDGMVDTGRI